MFAVVIARRSSDVWTRSGSTPASTSMRPPACASVVPLSESGTSTQPVNRLRAFQVLSPWRRRTSVEVMPPTLPAVSAVVPGGLQQVAERLQVARRLAPVDPPCPFLPHRGEEPDRQQVVERAVG